MQYIYLCNVLISNKEASTKKSIPATFMAWNRNVKHFENIWSRTRSSQKLFSIHNNSLDRRYEMHFYHVGLWCLLDHSRYTYFNTKDFTWHFFYTSFVSFKNDYEQSCSIFMRDNDFMIEHSSFSV